jgi:predicted TPR repeat methyltransferase/Tfp pilus assembly protein PilF
MMFFRRITVVLVVSLVLILNVNVCVSAISGSTYTSPDEFLALGDSALTNGEDEEAIEFYQQGIAMVTEDDVSLLTELSLHTNLATAYSSTGQEQMAAKAYEHALISYKNSIGDIVDEAVKRDAGDIAAQAAFFIGMVYQDMGQPRDAAEAYEYANTLDPLHWASVANLGSVLHDELRKHREAVVAYNKAYNILTDMEHEPTDPPPESHFILSQLQYRIGLCISHDLTQKCKLQDNPDSELTCKELATHAFALAVEFDPDNDSAKHMLATITADATVKRASNTYVKSLFDNYAQNFEHSLVQELGYTGYERLRRGFDRAFGGTEKVPTFSKVVDAGCGTGLVGEQFRNVSQHLIGVDLSQGILDEAVKVRPTLYDQVLVGDVTQVFRDQKPISLIIAADSYIYFGDLDPLFESMQEGLKDGGYAAFTLENVDVENEKMLADTKPDWRWQLTASGRFAHRKEYALSVGQAHQLELMHYEKLDDFRFEKGVGVQGHIFVMKKTSADQEL